MDDIHAQLQELTRLVRDLTQRVYRLEQALGLDSNSSEQRAGHVAGPHLTGGATSTNEQAPRRGVLIELKERASRPGLESRIGSQWLNRVGIVAVLVGVSYFLKYAFESNWIGPAARVVIGLVAGLAVVIWSEWFRTRGYRVFSYSLKAVGIGVLYLSIWAAFQVYKLVPVGMAFVAMVLVTAMTAAMAVAQNAEILAALALAGGFATPVLLSTGQNREVQLFSYLAVLDVATLVLTAVRPWRRMLALSFVGTVALYAGWYVTYYTRDQLGATLMFATAFFVMFAIAPLVGFASGPEGFASGPALLTVISLLNAGLYFLTAYVMLKDVDKNDAAWLAVVLAIGYVVLAWRLRQTRGEAAGSLARLQVAVAVGFITTAIAIRLEAHWITIGWFVEAGALLLVATRLRSDVLSGLSVAALALGVARLLLFDNFAPAHLIFNARMGTYAIAIGVLGGIAWYGSQQETDGWRRGAAVALVALNLLALVALTREVDDYFSRELRATSGGAQLHTITVAREFGYSALWMAYGAMLMLVGFWRRSPLVRWQALVLVTVTSIKVFVYDVSQLERGYRILSFIVLGVLLLAISFAYQRDWLRLGRDKSIA